MTDLISQYICSASEIAIFPALGALIASEVMGTREAGQNSVTGLILAFLGALTSKDKPKTKSKRKSKRKIKLINKGEPSDI